MASLSKRLGSTQEETDPRIYLPREVFFSMEHLQKRYENKVSGDINYLGKDTKTAVHSFLPGDIVWGWKHPNDVPDWYKHTPRYKIYKNFSEVKMVEQGKTFGWTCFNHLPLKFLWGAFENNEELYACIILYGISDPQTPVIFNDEDFNDDIMDTSERKSETVRVYERNMCDLYNLAHNGTKFERVGAGDLLEAYLPPFDHTTYGPGGVVMQPLDDYIGSNDWMKKHIKSQHHTYQPDKRITLLYQKVQRKTLRSECEDTINTWRRNITTNDDLAKKIDQLYHENRRRVFARIKVGADPSRTGSMYVDFNNIGR